MQSETIGALAAALAKAQGAMKPAPMDRDNPFFKSKYATLTSLWESARAALSANGLAVVQATDFDGNGDLVLVTTLVHSSGEWMGGVYPIRTADAKPQTLGSAISYARRYALGALVGLTSDDDDDDDGNAASNGASNAPQHKEASAQHRTPPAAASATTTSAPTAGKASNGNGGAGNGQSAAMKAFQATGAKLYGQEWEAKRHEIIKAYTKGRTESSKELTPDELAFLTARMDAKLQEELAAVNMADAPEMEPS